MTRRLLLAATLLALATAAAAQRAVQPSVRIAFVAPGSQAQAETRLTALRNGLCDNGLAEARDYVLDPVFADGKPDRLPVLAKAARGDQVAVTNRHQQSRKDAAGG